MQLRDLQRVVKIRDYCLDIQEDVKRFGESFEVFSADTTYQKAIAFSVLQIGELATGLSEEFRNATKEQVQWHLVRGMRNTIVHDYGKIELDKVWETVMNDIPALKDFCNNQLPDEYRDE